MSPLNLGLVVHMKNYISDAENTSNSKKFCEFIYFKDSVTIKWVLVALLFLDDVPVVFIILLLGSYPSTFSDMRE